MRVSAKRRKAARSLVWSAIACSSAQPTIKFLLYQGWLFQQADHLSPDDLIEELLSDEAAVVANLAAEFPPALGANALVVVSLTCAGLR